MSMPTNCLDCPACNEYLMCAIPCNGRGCGENDVKDYGQGRPEWCPMKEQEIVRCRDCRYRSFYCTEATDGTTLYECHHPCANSVPRPGDWFCADGKRKEGR